MSMTGVRNDTSTWSEIDSWLSSPHEGFVDPFEELQTNDASVPSFDFDDMQLEEPEPAPAPRAPRMSSSFAGASRKLHSSLPAKVAHKRAMKVTSGAGFVERQERLKIAADILASVKKKTEARQEAAAAAAAASTSSSLPTPALLASRPAGRGAAGYQPAICHSGAPLGLEPLHDFDPMMTWESHACFSPATDQESVCSESMASTSTFSSVFSESDASTPPSSVHSSENMSPSDCSRMDVMPALAKRMKYSTLRTESFTESGSAPGKTSVLSLTCLLDKPLPPQVALAMLLSASFNPGPRPPIFNELEKQWLFKERSGTSAAPMRGKQQKDEQRADRWHNSGGVRGSRDMEVKGESMPMVRRRYGSIVRNKKIRYRYHEYSLLYVREDITAPDGKRFEEDRTTAIFHVMQKRTGKGRPSKAEADEPLQLWRRHPYGRTLLICP